MKNEQALTCLVSTRNTDAMRARSAAEHILEHPQAKGITEVRERIGAPGQPPKSALHGVHEAESSSVLLATCPRVASYKGDRKFKGTGATSTRKIRASKRCQQPAPEPTARAPCFCADALMLASIRESRCSQRPSREKWRGYLNVRLRPPRRRSRPTTASDSPLLSSRTARS
jgi:hypothetical protein